MIKHDDFKKLHVGSILSSYGVSYFWQVTEISKHEEMLFRPGCFYDRYKIQRIEKVENGVPVLGWCKDRLIDRPGIPDDMYYNFNLIKA